MKDQEAPNYEEKAQEIVQSILQEVVNTVTGGESSSVHFQNVQNVQSKISKGLIFKNNKGIVVPHEDRAVKHRKVGRESPQNGNEL